MKKTSFTLARAKAIEALQEGTVEHEARAVQSKKNLLATGAIDLERAIDLLQSTSGKQADSSPHHDDSSLEVWVFKPTGWYIKFYFLDSCCFISFHESL